MARLLTEKKRKFVVCALFALVSLIALASSLTLAAVWLRLRAEGHPLVTPSADGRKRLVAAFRHRPLTVTADASAATATVCTASASAATNRPGRVEGIDVEGAGGETPAVAIRLSQRPKPEEVLRAVTLQPAVEDLSVDVEAVQAWQQPTSWKVLLKSPNFARRTHYTVTVGASLPFERGARLAQGVRRTVEIPDLSPSVSLSATGRYLPPVGEKAVGVTVVNVTNLACAVRAVVPENVIQLLAREEGRYTESLPRWGAEIDGDSAATAELAAAPIHWTEPVPHPLNVRARHALRLRAESGLVSNGVYLLSVRNGDRPEGDANRPAYRLVCLTDLGLSARRDADGLRVWVTSLTTGRPRAGLVARLYASSRVRLAQGETDADGEVTLSGWDARDEPFALVVTSKDGSDSAFMALRETMQVDETLPCGARPPHLAADASTAFVWTDRGIYRHGEKMLVHAVLRTGAGDAPKPFPVVVSLVKPDGAVAQTRTRVCDDRGALAVEDFFAPVDQPSGKWKVTVAAPGSAGARLGERTVTVEEFVPPQVRVSVVGLPDAACGVSNIAYTVRAENLFGGPAKLRATESLVSFSDAAFAPSGWKGFRFGDPRRGLQPNCTRLKGGLTDAQGMARFAVGMKDGWGLPQSAVRLTVQGAVFEAGGRPAVTRDSRIVHRYPYYLGSDVPRVVPKASGTRTFRVSQVNPDGTAHREARRLAAALWKVDCVYGLEQRPDGSSVWDSERMRHRVAELSVAMGADGTGTVAMPVSGSGDYELVVEDAARGLSHCAPFWISAPGDDELRASLKNPTAVTIVADKAFYRPGERPRLTVKTPFRGAAWLAVMREKTLATRTLELTNLTSVVELEPLAGAWAPNVDVALSVVQAVAPGRPSLAARAHGLVSLRIRPQEREIPAAVTTSVRGVAAGGCELDVRVSAEGAENSDARAVVTVVDEGLNLLTNEPVPDPIGFFARARGGEHPLYDLFGRLLPVCGASLKANGAKTGGDDLAGLMSRVSPVPSRRFRPLSLWWLDVPLTGGVAHVRFALPEFVGEVRVTALVCTARGTGCAAVRQKVCPKLVLQPDAPRFAAPGDRFDLTLALSNRSGREAEIAYEVTAGGAVALAAAAAGRTTVADGDTRILTVPAVAKAQVGEGRVTFRAEGCGEMQVRVIELPVRPAVPWEETATVVALSPGEAWTSSNACGVGSLAAATQRAFSVSGSPVAELVAAFDFLAAYPHGCLEQTASRMFPLLVADDFLDLLPSSRTSKASEWRDIVAAGVARVASMLRQNDFTMWPDCTCPPWDREVSLYAAHFLVAAAATGHAVDRAVQARVRRLLKTWAQAPDLDQAAYACHTLALAGAPERDRLFTLFDARARLSLLARARLARAFVRVGDPLRARTLLADAALSPKDVREAAFALVALLEMDAQDPRLGRLVLFLQNARDRTRFHWGTTGANAHALWALASCLRVRGVGEGRPRVSWTPADGGACEELPVGQVRRVDGGGAFTLRNVGACAAFVSFRQCALPAAASVTNARRLVRVSRRFFTTDGQPVDLAKARLARGDLLVGEITLAADRTFAVTDLVVQDLLPACFEPERMEVAAAFSKRFGHGRTDWVLRHDARDDRLLVFSRPMTLRPASDGAGAATFAYAVRVVSAGDFTLPGVRVEAMYAPEVFAQAAPGRVRVTP